MANGVGLRFQSLRGSWVRIPPPAPYPMSPNLRLLKADAVQYGMKDVIKEVYDYEWRLANAEKRLDESESICNEDKETIRRFIRHLKAQDVSTGRLAKYTYHLKNAIERLGTGTQRAKREDIERLVAWLQHDVVLVPNEAVAEEYRRKLANDDRVTVKTLREFLLDGRV